MSPSNSAALVISALIIGGSIVAGSFLVRNSVDRTGDEVNELRATIAAAAKPQREAVEREAIDRNRRYTISTKGSPVRGDPDATIAVVEFSDFQCPFCGRSVKTLDQIAQTYGDRVRIVFKHLPLQMHAKARPARRGCRGRVPPGQVLGDAQQDLRGSGEHESGEVSRVRARARARPRALRSRSQGIPTLMKRIDADLAEAQGLGVTGTPAFFVNGRYVPGAVPFESIRALLDEDLGKNG